MNNNNHYIRIILIISIIVCITSLASHIIQHVDQTSEITPPEHVSVKISAHGIPVPVYAAPKATYIINTQLAADVFRTKRNHLHIDDIADLYTPLYELARQDTDKAAKKQFAIQIMRMNDICSNIRRSRFNPSRLRYLPFMQQQHVIDILIPFLQVYETETEQQEAKVLHLLDQLHVIHETILTSKQYRKETLIFGQKNGSGLPGLEFLKIAFGAVKLLF